MGSIEERWKEKSLRKYCRGVLWGVSPRPSLLPHKPERGGKPPGKQIGKSRSAGRARGARKESKTRIQRGKKMKYSNTHQILLKEVRPGRSKPFNGHKALFGSQPVRMGRSKLCRLCLVRSRRHDFCRGRQDQRLENGLGKRRQKDC